MFGRFLSLLLAISMMGGCASHNDQTPESDRENARTRPVVIALIDSGADAAPDVFRSNTTHSDLESWGIAAAIYDETRGVPTSQLNWFEGTRLLGITFTDEELRDAVGHGSMTTYLAAREAPKGLIVLVQVDGRACQDGAASCVIGEGFADAMEWIADQGWIDIVSISAGSPANMPAPPEPGSAGQRFVEATRRAVAAGKLVLAAAGNEGAPTIASPFAGPPWMIAVGGAHPTSNGESPYQGRAVDLVANYTDMAPAHGAPGMASRSGTSIATPLVAATLAEALSRLPAEAVIAGPGLRLRSALNASAIAIAPTDWRAPPIPTPGGAVDWLQNASLPIIVQPQMGWGYVNSSLAPEIARRVLENDLSIPAGKEQAAIFQAEWQRAREEYWARYAG